MSYFPKAGTGLPSEKGLIRVETVEIFRELAYVRVPAEEWGAVKLNEFNKKFKAVNVD